MNLDLDTAREQMITQQVRTWSVLDDRVLQALRDVPREQFVPEGYQNLAFADAGLPLAHAQVMLSPKIEGKILQYVDIQHTDEVLVIGAGSGYLAACAGQLAGKVRVIEFYPDLVATAQRNLQRVISNNVSVEVGDATQLTADKAYDVIIVTASLPIYDERYQRALKLAGRLFIVIGATEPMEAVRVTRTGETTWQRDSLFETDLPALVNATYPSRFVF